MSFKLQNSFLGASFSVHTYFSAEKLLRPHFAEGYEGAQSARRPAQGTAKPAPSTSFVV
jgi:hypothetical protein